MIPWTAARQGSLSITNSQSLLKLMSIESVMPFKHLILCNPLLLLPSIFPSIRVFSNESLLCIRWPKYWSFSFNINPSNEYSELISFRMDWTPCSPRDSQESSPTLKFKSINSSVLSLPYGPILTSIHDCWKKTYLWLYRPLTIWTFVSKVMSLLSNMLFRFAIAFLPRSKRLLISFKPAFSLSFVPSSSGSSSEESSSSLFAVRVVSSAQE